MKTSNKEPEKDLKKSFYLGERIKKARKHANYTQTALAECIGVTRQTVNNWEHGIATPDYDTLSALCDYLKCDAGYLFGEYDEFTCTAKSMKEYTGLSDENIENIHDLLTFSFGDEKAIKFINCLIENSRALYVPVSKKYHNECKRIELENDPYGNFLRNAYEHMRKKYANFSVDFCIDNFVDVVSDLAFKKEHRDELYIDQFNIMRKARYYYRFLEDEYLGIVDNLITKTYLAIIDVYFEEYVDPYGDMKAEEMRLQKMNAD